jgi:aldehyde:ferredoxin oxidoreductase
MGSKKLKAIAVRGSGKPVIAKPQALEGAVSQLRQLAKDSLFAGMMSESGTPLHLDTMVTVGDITIKNWTIPRWKGTKKLGAKAMKKRGDMKKYACFGCPVACKKLLQYEGEWVKMPEYETLALLGTNLLVDDLETLIKWNILVNDLGVDSISLGGCIAGFLEAVERNLLDVDAKEFGFPADPENAGAYQIWGAKEVIEKLIKMICLREGVGKELAEGIRRFCEVHDLPEELAIHGKGLEVPAHEPRASNLTTLDYATTPRGAYHCFEPMLVSFNMNLKEELGITEIVDRFGADDAVVETVKKIQDFGEAFSAGGNCFFGAWFIHKVMPWIEALNAITGRSYTLESWMAAGERIFNLKRAYNVECGISKKDDTVGSRFFTAFEKGGCRGKVPPLDKLLTKYYEIRGWDRDGVPPN